MDGIDGMRIESDENGFELVLEGDFEHEVEAYMQSGKLRFNMHAVAFEFGNSRGLADLLDWCSEANVAKAEAQRMRADERAEVGFEGVGDFTSDDPMERYRAHQAAKGRL